MKRVPVRPLGIVLAVVALVVLARHVDWRLAWHILSHAHLGWVAAAAGINLANFVFEAARWRFIVAGFDRAVRLRYTLLGMLACSVGNIILPLKMGEAVRAWLVARKLDAPFLSLLSTTMVDRSVDVVCFSLPVLAAAAVFPLHSWLGPRRLRLVIGVSIGLIVFISVMAVIIRRHGTDEAARSASRVKRSLAHLAAGFGSLRSAGMLVPVLAAAVASWTARGAVIWAMGRALDLQLGIAASALVLVILNVGIVSMSTPANIGSFEASAVLALHLLHVSDEAGLAFGLGLHLAELVPTIVVALLALSLDGIGWSVLSGREGPPSTATGDDAPAV